MVKNFKLGLIFGSLILIAVAVFVMALEPGIPVNLNFTNNATPLYDEGNFTLNWTAATGSNATAYNISIWVDDVFWITGDNDSLTGYSFNNWTDANYTFAVASWNSTDGDGANSFNISMVVDRTNPVMEYTSVGINVDNANVSQNWVSVNITASDIHNSSAATISYFIYNSTGLWNQTNFTDAYTTTTINWTGLVDGVYTYNVTINDSATNENSTTTRTITLDTTNPVATLSCTPSSVSQNEVVTCICSGSDIDGSGINSTLTSNTTTPSTASTGTYTASSCSVTDYAGNSDSASDIYDVTGTSSSGESSYVVSFWTKGTHSVTDTQFADGFVKELSAKQRLKIKVGSAYHHVGVIELTATSATINISSDPQQAVLSIGDEEKFEITGDDYYDILVKLNSISDSKANVTVLSINELVVVEESVAEDGMENTVAADVDPDEPEVVDKPILWWILGGVGLVIVLGIGTVVILFKKGKLLKIKELLGKISFK
jgi:hypothetical protein